MAKSKIAPPESPQEDAKAKHTVFSFITTRSPELLTRAVKDQYFVHHPDLESSIYFSNTFDAATNGTLAEYNTALASDLSHFAGKEYKTPEAVEKALGVPFYNFENWFAKNRNVIVQFGFDPTNGGIEYDDGFPEALSDPQMYLVWDTLFYLSLTGLRVDVREQMIQLLIANQFIVRGAKPEDNKMADARVVIPKTLYGPVTDGTSDPEPTPDVLVNTAPFLKSIEKKESLDNIEDFKTILKFISKAQSTYERNNIVAYKAAKIAHEALLVTIQEDWDAAHAGDPPPAPGTKRPQPTFPVFGFKSIPTIFDTDNFYSIFDKGDEGLARLAESIELETAGDFTSAINMVNAEINELNGNLFKNSRLSKNVLIIGNQRVPVAVGPDPDPLVLLYNYVISLSPIATNLYKIILAVNMGSPNASVNNASYTAHFGSDPTEQEFTQISDGNTLVLTFFYSAGIHPTSFPFLFDGYIVLQNGTKLLFTTNLTQKGGKGAMTVDAPTETPTTIRYGITRVGIDDYRRVEQEVCCYVAGEVSHIENVMASEYKERSTRLLRRTEDTTTTEKSTESEKLTDTSSTDRFEMQQQTAKAMSESTSLGINASVTYTPNKILTASLAGSYAHNTSQQESNNQSVNISKEITQKASEKIVQKVREERIIKIIDEFEEQNKHGFDNRGGTAHISGVYRWIDKIYKNQVFNYGKRLIYEFMIPQPARFHIEAMKLQGSALPTLVEPIDPRVGDGVVTLRDFTWLDENNYAHWAGVYNVTLDPPPTPLYHINKTYGNALTVDGDETISFNEDIEIPEGYQAEWASIIAATHTDGDGGQYHFFAVSVGDASWRWTNEPASIQEYYEANIRITRNKVPVSLVSLNMEAVHLGVSVRVARTPEAYTQWKMDSFNAIIKAYEAKKAAYDQAMAIESAKPTNPGFFRIIENTVLRKCCISYLVGQGKMGEFQLYNGDKLLTTPENSPRMETYAALVKFIEQAFEWEILSYTFYPFYWAFKDDWKEAYLQDVDDDIFRAFLQSGMARTFISVRPGFEEAVMYYMATGVIWNGGQVPIIGDDLYLSIVDELKNPTYYIEETWETRVPTTLVALQSGTISLDETGLPCSCGDENNILGVNVVAVPLPSGG